MRVCIAGAGVTGLVCALRLTQAGHTCDVYERWPGLGGQAATLDADGARIERYYHHWFTSDRHIAALCDELGVGIEWLPSSVAFFIDGRQHAFTTPLDLLRFKPLSLTSRLRTGLAVLRLQRSKNDHTAYEHQTARGWIVDHMGRQAWEKLWGPLLRGKFGSRADDISMAWLHGKLTQRRELKGKDARVERLGYPVGSFEVLFRRLRERIEAGGGRVLVDRPVARLERDGDGWTVWSGAPDSFRRGHDPGAFEVVEPAERYDAVVATVPNDVFLALAGQWVERGRLESIEYHAALCLLLELDRPFSPFYWTNVADPELPFVGLIEHTNFVSPDRSGGRHFLYVANYLEHGHDLLGLSDGALLDAYEDGLRKVNPEFTRDWVRHRWRFAEPAAQPIVDVGYHERIPPLRTGVPGLILANTTQVYPEDRGTNYAVRLGEEAARAVTG